MIKPSGGETSLKLAGQRYGRFNLAYPEVWRYFVLSEACVARVLSLIGYLHLGTVATLTFDWGSVKALELGYSYFLLMKTAQT